MGTRREEMLKVWLDIAAQGFTKSFLVHDYKEIENKTFHKLRLRYLKAREQLTNYVVNHTPEADENKR